MEWSLSTYEQLGSPSGQLTKDYRDSFQLWVEKDGKLVTKIGDTQL